MILRWTASWKKEDGEAVVQLSPFRLVSDNKRASGVKLKVAR